MASADRIALRWLLAASHPRARTLRLQASGPDDAEAAAFLARWLTAHGYEPPPLLVTNEGIPEGANAATVCRGGACVDSRPPGRTSLDDRGPQRAREFVATVGEPAAA